MEKLARGRFERRSCSVVQDTPAESGGAPRSPRRMLRLPLVEERTGLARSSIYRMVEAGDFPRPAHVGRRAVAWDESEIEAFLARKLAERGAAR